MSRGVVIGEAAAVVRSKKWQRWLAGVGGGSKKREMVSSMKPRGGKRRPGGRDEVGGWVAAWLQEAEDQTDKEIESYMQPKTTEEKRN